MINGPEAFTPDGEFILGETEIRGSSWQPASAHGIAGAGGVGKVMAEWIVDGEPELDVWRMDIRRFGTHYRSRRYALARSVEIYATYYDIHYPNEERSAGRPLKTAPTYERLRHLEAEFGEKAGWGARTGSGPTRTFAWSTCGREAGRVSTGRRRSPRNTRRRANMPDCSTSPRSRRSRSRETMRAPSLRGSARIASIGRSDGSSTRRC